jgi:hypothetical protein
MACSKETDFQRNPGVLSRFKRTRKSLGWLALYLEIFSIAAKVFRRGREIIGCVLQLMVADTVAGTNLDGSHARNQRSSSACTTL